MTTPKASVSGGPPTSVEMNRMVQDYIGRHAVNDLELINQWRQLVLQMYNLPLNMTYFCGALPCSLMRADLKYLHDMEYMVSEKTDGVRFLLLAYHTPDRGPLCLLVDRGFRFYYCDVTLASFVFQGCGSLFDGEIIWEPTGFKYYIHDVVCLSGKRSISSATYQDRMAKVVEVLRWGCFPSASLASMPAGAADTLELLPKKIYPLTRLPHVLSTIIPNLAHRSDGLILTPNALPHRGKKNKMLFKHKDPEDHTIDLKLGARDDTATDVGKVEHLDDTLDGLGPTYPAYHLQTWDTKVVLDFCHVSMSPERWKSIGVDPEQQKGIIVECKYHSDRGMWVPIAWRKDKLVPNDTHTVSRTIETMIEGLTIEELVNIARHLGERSLQDRPPLKAPTVP